MINRVVLTCIAASVSLSATGASAQKLQVAVQQSQRTGLPLFVMGSSDT